MNVYKVLLFLLLSAFMQAQALPTIEPEEGEEVPGYVDGEFVEDAYLYEEKTDEGQLTFGRGFVLEPEFKDRYQETIFDYHRVQKKNRKKKPPSPPKVNLDFLADFGLYLLYAIGLLLIGLVLYAFVRDSDGLGWRSKNKKSLAKKLEEEGWSEDIEQMDIRQNIRLCKEKSQWREAVRWYYLFVLQRLQEKKWIQFQIDKTDTTYLSELQERPIRDAFFAILMTYFRIWYGKREISAEQFAEREQAFLQLLNDLDA